MKYEIGGETMETTLTDIIFNAFEKLNMLKNTEQEVDTIYEIFQMLKTNNIETLEDLDKCFKIKRYQ